MGLDLGISMKYQLLDCKVDRKREMLRSRLSENLRFTCPVFSSEHKWSAGLVLCISVKYLPPLVFSLRESHEPGAEERT